MSISVPNPGAQWTDTAAAQPATILWWVQDPATLMWTLVASPDATRVRGSLTRDVPSGTDVMVRGIKIGYKRPTKLPNGFVVFY